MGEDRFVYYVYRGRSYSQVAERELRHVVFLGTCSPAELNDISSLIFNGPELGDQ